MACSAGRIALNFGALGDWMACTVIWRTVAFSATRHAGRFGLIESRLVHPRLQSIVARLDLQHSSRSTMQSVCDFSLSGTSQERAKSQCWRFCFLQGCTRESIPVIAGGQWPVPRFNSLALKNHDVIMTQDTPRYLYFYFR